MNVWHVDLFSGIGGFLEAARMSGWRTVAGCEIDEREREFLTRQYPEVEWHGDCREVDWKPYQGVEIITGGPPCQPVSCAGQRRGTADNRWLWSEALRAVSEIRPAWTLFENPLGLANMGLDGICAELAALGYEVGTVCIPACSVNAPHRRGRLWIIGALADADGIGWEVSADDGRMRDSEGSGKARPTAVRISGADPWNDWELFPRWTPNGIVVCRSLRGFRGLADGLRYDKRLIAGLGNAIVPQVAARIMAAMRMAEKDAA